MADCLLAIAAHVLQLKLQVGNTLANNLGLRAGVLHILLFIIEPATKVLIFLLKRRHLVEKVLALIFGRRLVPDCLGMLRSKALNPPLEPFPLENQL